MKIIFKSALCLMAAVMLAGCERPPIETVQTGFRGTGMEQIYNPRTLAKQASLNAAPAAAEAASEDGPKAKDVYKNVQVLGDLSVGQFNRHMAPLHNGFRQKRVVLIATMFKILRMTISTPRWLRVA